MKRAIYDLLYRIGAPWDGPPRPELVTLVESGVLTTASLAPGRAIDLGCGTGANLRFLARHGFEATGVDFSLRCGVVEASCARRCRARSAMVSDGEVAAAGSRSGTGAAGCGPRRLTLSEMAAAACSLN